MRFLFIYIKFVISWIRYHFSLSRLWWNRSKRPEIPVDISKIVATTLHNRRHRGFTFRSSDAIIINDCIRVVECHQGASDEELIDLLAHRLCWWEVEPTS